VARRANKKEKKRAMGVSAANVSLITARKKKRKKNTTPALITSRSNKLTGNTMLSLVHVTLYNYVKQQ